MLRDMQCRLLVYKQHSMHWFKMDRFYHPLCSLTASETGANTNTLSIYQLCYVYLATTMSGIYGEWICWCGREGGGGCQTLMNSGGFYLCIDTAKWLVAIIMTEWLSKVGKNLEIFQWWVWVRGLKGLALL